MLDLPPDYSLERDEARDRYYVKCGDKYIVTKHAGNRKWFKGTSPLTIQNAERWTWRYSNGMIDGFEKI